MQKLKSLLIYTLQHQINHVMKKIIIGILIIFLGTILYSHIKAFNTEKAAIHVTEHAAPRSKTCCAWYVMRAMHSGGCWIGIYPAWAYKYVLPLYNFERVDKNNYHPRKGDIVVIENSEEHFWGHIAMYNGRIWISDFKQRNMSPYKKTYPYEIFRYKK